jgi:hypothetical protein
VSLPRTFSTIPYGTYGIAKLLALVQEEGETLVLERIATRPYDALIDKAQFLRTLNSASSLSSQSESKSKKASGELFELSLCGCGFRFRFHRDFDFRTFL